MVRVIKNCILIMDNVSYRKLSAADKMSRISKAKILQEYRGPNPLGKDEFPDQNFIDFKVNQKGKQIKLHTYRYNTEAKSKAIIFMFHGLNAHIGQGAHLARCFAAKEMVTVGFDHRGFGKSEGEPGYIESFQEHLDDCKKFIKIVQEQYKKQYKEEIVKLGLGLSMGGMTVYYLAFEDPKLFKTVVLMAPALIHRLPSLVPRLSNIISSILPKSTRLLPPFADKSNRNPTVMEHRKTDPNCFNSRACLSTMNFIVSIMSKSQQTFKNFK